MICPNCKNEIAYGVKFCNECGAKITYEEMQTENVSMQGKASNDVFGGQYVNLSDTKVKEIALYIGNWVALIVLVLMWCFTPVITYKDYDEYVEQLHDKYGSAASMMETTLSLPKMVEQFIEYVKNVDSASDTEYRAEMGFLIAISVVAIGVVIVLASSAVSMLTALLRRDKNVLDKFRIFAVFSLVMSIILSLFAMAYNSYCEAAYRWGVLEIKLAIMGYVIPILAIVYNSVVSNVSSGKSN